MYSKVLVMGIMLVILINIMMDLICSNEREFLTARPNDSEKNNMTREIMSNRKIFEDPPISIEEVRMGIPWMDAIVYEDIRRLVREKKFNDVNIKQALS